MPKQSIVIAILLAIILLSSFFIRVYKNSEIPSGFFADEASISYNAYSILKTGKDEFGVNFPFLFQSFGNFRPGVSIYASIPSIFIFGMNEFSSRLTPALTGTFTVLIIYFLGKELFSSSLIGLSSAFFLAISPWHIQFSRVGMENIYFPFFVCLSLVFLLTGARKKKASYLIASFISFGLTLYTYVIAYFITPLLLFMILIIYRKTFLQMWKASFVGLICFFIISIPLLTGIQQGKTLARFKDLNSTQHHSISNNIQGMTKTYIDSFSLDFLFSKGDIGFPNHFITRFSVRGMGELYWFQMPFILLGILFAYIKNKKVFLLLLGLLLIYPLGSTVVPFSDGGGPFVTRSIIGIIPFQILSSAGIIFLFSLTRNKISKVILGITFMIVISLFFKDYLHRYFVEYPLHSSDFWGWQYGTRKIVNYFVQNQSKYDELIMAPEFNAPEIFFKFYAPNDCQKCLVGLPSSNYNPNLKQLFAVTPDYLRKNPNLKLSAQKYIYYPNKTIAFIIGFITHN